MLIKGQVLDLNLTPNASGSGSFRLMEESVDFDKNADCRVKVPEEWLETINFGEFSTCYVLGNPWVIQNQGQNKLVGITALGIYPTLINAPHTKVNGIEKSDVTTKETDEFADYKEVNIQ